METITKRTIPAEQIDALDSIAATVPGPEIQELLQSLIRCLRDGDDVVAVAPDSTMTPNQVSQRLGMSRTHLYKLLDGGAIPSHRVGRDRRILLADVIRFEEQRQADRRELAERFANQKRTRDATVDELAELL